MRYHLITLGCQMNHSDSERVRTVMEGMGCVWTDREEEADLLGVLACSVRQKAIDRVYGRVHRWNSWKDGRSVLTFVTGCVLAADRQRFLKLFDFVFTMNELPGFPKAIREYGVVTAASLRGVDGAESADAVGGMAATEPAAVGAFLSLDSLKKEVPVPAGEDSRPVMADVWTIKPTPQSSMEAFVPIQNGCNKFCTFCAVPYTRGREVSRRSEEILAEIRDLVARGFKSITLLGQNVNSYGLDRKGDEMRFADLLENIGRYGDAAGRDFWVYFTSPHPRDMTPEVIMTMARHRCLARQVHLPLQSGDDKVLLRMNRQHGMAQYRETVALIRRELPDATLFTDIIVGFSGETEEQFERTRAEIETLRFTMAFIAMYSPRPGAASWRWPDDVPAEEKKRRYHRMNEVVVKSSLDWNQGLVGREIPVLVTAMDRSGASLLGLTEGRINARLTGVGAEAIGQFVTMRVTEAQSFNIAGEWVRSGLPESESR